MKFKINKRVSNQVAKIDADMVTIAQGSGATGPRIYVRNNVATPNNVVTTPSWEYVTKREALQRNNINNRLDFNLIPHRGSAVAQPLHQMFYSVHPTHHTIYPNDLSTIMVPQGNATMTDETNSSYFTHNATLAPAGTHDEALDLFFKIGRGCGFKYQHFHKQPAQQLPVNAAAGPARYGAGFWMPSTIMDANPTGTPVVVDGKDHYPAFKVPLTGRSSNVFSFSVWIRTFNGDASVKCMSKNSDVLKIQGATTSFRSTTPAEGWTHFAGIYTTQIGFFTGIQVNAEAGAEVKVAIPWICRGYLLRPMWTHSCPIHNSMYKIEGN